MKYILNPYYALKNDKKRILLSNAPSFKIPNELAEQGIVSFLHPVFAIILSFFHGDKDLENVIDEISDFLDEPTSVIRDLILPLVENKENVGFVYDGNLFEFPKRTLIEREKQMPLRDYNPKEFFINENLDFKTQRLFTSPSEIRILINTKCSTDCIYCYVDRRIKDDCKIPFKRIKELIEEAKQIGVTSFNFAGSEIFLYKYWDKFAEELLKNGYYPYLSTKIPIGSKIIDRLCELGIKDIQLSIDTLIDEQLCQVNKYANPRNNSEKMLLTLDRLQKKSINVAVNSVITKYNCSIESISHLLEQLSKFKNITIVTLNFAEKSVYKSEEEFLKFRVSLSDIETIKSFQEKYKDNYKFEIVIPGVTKKESFINSKEEKSKNFATRGLCTAGTRQICILPDGKVTICEELYWHPKFIIGDVLNNSIQEIWNSSGALSLVNPSQNNFSNDSICKSCNNFEICRMGAGVCYSDIISLYGEDKWDYPSPECPKAPKPNYVSYFE